MKKFLKDLLVYYNILARFVDYYEMNSNNYLLTFQAYLLSIAIFVRDGRWNLFIWGQAQQKMVPMEKQKFRLHSDKIYEKKHISTR